MSTVSGVTDALDPLDDAQVHFCQASERVRCFPGSSGTRETAVASGVGRGCETTLDVDRSLGRRLILGEKAILRFEIGRKPDLSHPKGVALNRRARLSFSWALLAFLVGWVSCYILAVVPRAKAGVRTPGKSRGEAASGSTKGRLLPADGESQADGDPTLGRRSVGDRSNTKGPQRSQLRKAFGLLVLAVTTVTAGWSGISLLTVDRRMPKPPEVAGGIILLVEAKAIRYSSPSLALSIEDRTSPHPRVTLLVETGDSRGLLLLSGSMLPYDRVSGADCDKPSCFRQVREISLHEKDGFSTYDVDKPTYSDDWVELPGLSFKDGVQGVEVSFNSVLLTWRLKSPMAVSGRGNEAGRLPAIGTPDLSAGITASLTTRYRSRDPDTGEIEHEPQGFDSVDPARQVLNRRERSARDRHAVIYAVISKTEGTREDDEEWGVPTRMDTAVVVRGLSVGQRVESLSPDGTSDGSSLMWLSEPNVGQVSPMVWTTTDPSREQGSNDRLFIAALVLGLASATLLLILERIFLEDRA
jgi:hypothetical protein